MNELSLGIEVVQTLIPQRRPFLMVDRIVSFAMSPRPSVACVKHLSANEPFFEGHYPALAIMPGALTFEGLGQTANILAALLTLRRRFERAGRDPETVPAHLRNLQAGYALSRAFRPAMAQEFQALARGDAGEPEFGLVGAVTMKFLEPIFAGSRVEYSAQLSGEIDAYLQFDVEAVVDNRVKAKGSMSTIRGLGVSRHLGWVGGGTAEEAHGRE